MRSHRAAHAEPLDPVPPGAGPRPLHNDGKEAEHRLPGTTPSLTKIPSSPFLFLRISHTFSADGFLRQLHFRAPILPRFPPQDTKFVAHAQMPHLWHKAGGMHVVEGVDDLFVDHLERSSAMLADAVVSPSRRAWDRAGCIALHCVALRGIACAFACGWDMAEGGWWGGSERCKGVSVRVRCAQVYAPVDARQRLGRAPEQDVRAPESPPALDQHRGRGACSAEERRTGARVQRCPSPLSALRSRICLIRISS